MLTKALKLLLIPHLLFISLFFPSCSRDWDEPLLIAFDDGVNIFVINEDGTELCQVTTTGPSTNPSFSPDGENIVFFRTGNLYIINTDGTGERLLSAANDKYATWSPAGVKISYTNINSLYAVDPDGTDLTKISAEGDNNYKGPVSWAPGLDKIYCLHAGSSYLNVFSIGCTTPVQVSATGMSNGFSVSPDGAVIAYSAAGGLYVIKSDGTGVVQVTVVDGDCNPVWTPDGENIYFERVNKIYCKDLISGSERLICPGKNPCVQFKPR